MSSESRFHRWIFHSFPVTKEGLGFMRIVLSLLLLILLIPGEGLRHLQFLSGLPSDFYAPPPGPMLLIDQFPSYTFFIALHTLSILAVIAMLFGYKTKWASLLSGLTILLLQGLIFSVGKINHEILLAFVPACMAFSNWGAAFSIDSRNEEGNSELESWPLTLIALFLGFMMFTAGFPKVIGGWLDVTTQATQGHLLNQFYMRGRQDLLAETALNFQSIFFWEFLDWATVLFEIGFLVAVFNKRWFNIFVCLAVLFHFSTMLILNIAFLPNFLAYALFLKWDKILADWNTWYQKVTGDNSETSKMRSVISIAILIAILFVFLKVISLSNVVLNQSDLRLYEVVTVSSAALYVVYLGSKEVFKRS